MLYDLINKSMRTLIAYYAKISSLIYTLFSRTLEYKRNIEKNIPHWNMREKAHPAIVRFGLVIILVVLAIFLKYGINTIVGYDLPFMVLYSVIVVSAWYGGLKPGIVAVIFCTALGYIFFLPTSLAHHLFSSLIVYTLFALEGLLIVALSHSMHTALQTLEDKKIK
jgi:K+-sensing histidine kinase KdpD